MSKRSKKTTTVIGGINSSIISTNKIDNQRRGSLVIGEPVSGSEPKPEFWKTAMTMFDGEVVYVLGTNEFDNILTRDQVVSGITPYGITDVTAIELSDQVTETQSGPFEGTFEGMVNVTSPATLTSYLEYIDVDTFKGWNAINTATLDIPTSVTTIGSGAYFGWESFAGKIVFNNSSVIIGDNAFRNMYALTEIEFTDENTPTDISSLAFYGADSGINATVPVTLNSISKWKLELGHITEITSINGVDVNLIPDYTDPWKAEITLVDDTVVYANLGGGGGNDALLDRVDIIQAGATSTLSNVKNVRIGEGVTRIGTNALEITGFDVRQTGTVYIPSTVIDIDNGALSSWIYAERPPLFSPLSSPILRAGANYQFYRWGRDSTITELFTCRLTGAMNASTNVFHDSGIPKIYFPLEITSTDFGTFRNMDGLTELTFDQVGPPVIDPDTFYQTNATWKLYAPNDLGNEASWKVEFDKASSKPTHINDIPWADITAPVITSQPQSTMEAIGSTTTFSVEANFGVDYTWYEDDIEMVGETTNSITVDTGTEKKYHCIVGNVLGTVQTWYAYALLPPVSDTFKLKVIRADLSEQTVPTNGSTVLTRGECFTITDRPNVRQVIVGEGITELGIGAFTSDFSNRLFVYADSYKMPSTLQTIGARAFRETFKYGSRPDYAIWFHPFSYAQMNPEDPESPSSPQETFLYSDAAETTDWYFPESSMLQRDAFKFSSGTNGGRTIFDNIDDIRTQIAVSGGLENIILTQAELPPLRLSNAFVGVTGLIYVNTSVTSLSEWQSAFSSTSSKFREWDGTININDAHPYKHLIENKLLGTEIPVPVSITTQPTDQTVASGSPATFSVTAEGSEPITYQWSESAREGSFFEAGTVEYPYSISDWNQIGDRTDVTYSSSEVTSTSTGLPIHEETSDTGKYVYAETTSQLNTSMGTGNFKPLWLRDPVTNADALFIQVNSSTIDYRSKYENAYATNITDSFTVQSGDIFFATSTISGSDISVSLTITRGGSEVYNATKEFNGRHNTSADFCQGMLVDAGATTLTVEFLDTRIEGTGFPYSIPFFEAGTTEYPFVAGDWEQFLTIPSEVTYQGDTMTLASRLGPNYIACTEYGKPTSWSYTADYSNYTGSAGRYYGRIVTQNNSHSTGLVYGETYYGGANDLRFYYGTGLVGSALLLDTLTTDQIPKQASVSCTVDGTSVSYQIDIICLDDTSKSYNGTIANAISDSSDYTLVFSSNYHDTVVNEAWIEGEGFPYQPYGSFTPMIGETSNSLTVTPGLTFYEQSSTYNFVESEWTQLLVNGTTTFNADNVVMTATTANVWNSNYSGKCTSAEVHVDCLSSDTNRIAHLLNIIGATERYFIYYNRDISELHMINQKGGVNDDRAHSMTYNAFKSVATVNIVGADTVLNVKLYDSSYTLLEDITETYTNGATTTADFFLRMQCQPGGGAPSSTQTYTYMHIQGTGYPTAGPAFGTQYKCNVSNDFNDIDTNIVTTIEA